MAEKKTGTVTFRQTLSPLLEIFRVMPEQGSAFPDYKAGQYVALSRDNCKLTRKINGPDGSMSYVPDLDEAGKIRRGTVTHSYSISSAPAETREKGFLEFYVVLEMIKLETPGRLSESLFHIDPESDNRIFYMNKIAGDFTLEKRAAGFQNVVMIGTGTGLAPFASMLKQLAHDALAGARSPASYTLFHANRTFGELGYHEELRSIEAGKLLDFVYVPSVSRPTARDLADPSIGIGRANNVLRFILGMPLREQEDLENAADGSSDAERKSLASAVRPRLPGHRGKEFFAERLNPDNSVILTCGNPGVMSDIRSIADRNRIRFEMEEW